ncbi:unnamed protein product [Dibothriocephalus latus]|uniref:Uncharacterized protein n=1 Tax=Dibothriocephalus latus TaxID=60516 RepID=A0A3P7Q6S5_DIBLA|nr:unnamed protein product [Dibothriocephalus latus]
MRQLFERAGSIHPDPRNGEKIIKQGRKGLQSTEDNSPMQTNQPRGKRSRKSIFLVGQKLSVEDSGWAVQALDPTSSLQEPLPELTRRKESRLVALNGLAYVIGGMVHSELSTSVVEFNPKTGRWRRVASNLLARWAHAAAGFGCGIISCGGWKGNTAIAFAELFLPAKNK